MIGKRITPQRDQGRLASNKLLCGAIGFLALSQTTAGSTTLLERALNPNPSLNSYSASTTLTATLHAVVPLQKTFIGSTYYLRPHQKIVFDNVSGRLTRFKELVTTMPTFEEARLEYSIKLVGDDGKRSSYELVPIKSGRRVKQILIDVGDDTALIERSVWSYIDGGTLVFEPSYETVGGFRLQAGETIKARFPAYSVDGSLRFTRYRLNEPISPSLFNPQV